MGASHLTSVACCPLLGSFRLTDAFAEGELVGLRTLMRNGRKRPRFRLSRLSLFCLPFPQLPVAGPPARPGRSSLISARVWLVRALVSVARTWMPLVLARAKLWRHWPWTGLIPAALAPGWRTRGLMRCLAACSSRWILGAAACAVMWHFGRFDWPCVLSAHVQSLWMQAPVFLPRVACFHRSCQRCWRGPPCSAQLAPTRTTSAT